MKILTIVGARPQFIKAAVISRCIRDNNLSIQEEIIHTGQHYDHSMSQVFFDEMDIPKPTVNLHIGSGTHGAATGEMLKGLEAEMLARKPDMVMVYGDTNSTLAGALAAAKLHIPVAHIEAGERSYNRQMPEEVNRVLTDHMSSLLFCCSEKSKNCLMGEGITKNVFAVGDVMYDAFLTYLPKAIWPKKMPEMLTSFALATLHRAQNTDDPQRLQSIMNALSALPEQIILPLHPRTLKMLQVNNVTVGANIHILEPVSYFEMLGLLKECAYVLTDSGGLQKEAYYAGKKCVVLRDETEWTELVSAGMNCIAGIEQEKIIAAAEWAKQITQIPQAIYGDGKAGEKIIGRLVF
jgi:UDP-GlcNAc3NAcA epimerase